MKNSCLKIIGPIAFAAVLAFCSVSNSEDGQAEEPGAAVPADKPATKVSKPPKAKVGPKLKPQRIMAGTWTIETTGAFSTTLTVKILPMTKDKKEITGQVFEGNEIVSSRIEQGTPGGKVMFKTTYDGGGSLFTIKWTGTLSEDVNEITEGEYEFQKGKGTFVAKRTK